MPIVDGLDAPLALDRCGVVRFTQGSFSPKRRDDGKCCEGSIFTMGVVPYVLVGR